jgi:hypothetical protein
MERTAPGAQSIGDWSGKGGRVHGGMSG